MNNWEHRACVVQNSDYSESIRTDSQSIHGAATALVLGPIPVAYLYQLLLRLAQEAADREAAQS